MKHENINAWVTKYALTKGIELVNGDVYHDINSGILSYKMAYSVYGNDWHRTPEAALARAEDMRHAKIKSLRKSIAKMEAMKFNAPTLTP